MSNSRGGRRRLAAATRGGILLGAHGKPARTVPLSLSIRRVRNARGEPLPCNYGPCWNDADDKIYFKRKHDDGRGFLKMIFCSDLCRAEWTKGTQYEQHL